MPLAFSALVIVYHTRLNSLLKHLRAWVELIFVPHWFAAGSDWFFKIQNFLLYCWDFDSVQRAVWPSGLRLFMPLWMVPVVASQDSFQKIEHEKAKAPDLSKIWNFASICHCAADDGCQRGRYGRFLVLQMALPSRNSPGRYAACRGGWRHTRGTGRALYLEKLLDAGCCDSGSFCVPN